MKRILFLLTTKSLEQPPPQAQVDGCGAMVEFLGIVRPEEDGKLISALDYEAYPEMAVKQAERHLDEVSRAHAVAAIHVVHRTGPVPVGEISVRVRVYAAHRQEAFAACSSFIDRLKQDVPIWKNPIPTI